MKINSKFVLACMLLVGCGTTSDTGCGANKNSEDVERVVSQTFRTRVVCIQDSPELYTCSDIEAQKLFRCAESTRSSTGIKCIPWFPLE